MIAEQENEIPHRAAACLTRQAAQVEDLLNDVHNHCDLSGVVEAMRLDLLNHPDEWENRTLER